MELAFNRSCRLAFVNSPFESSEMHETLIRLTAIFIGFTLSACGGSGTGAIAGNGETDKVSTPEVVEGYSSPTSFATDYCSTNIFPAQWVWRDTAKQVQSLGAISGTPLIKHVRNGTVIATYTQLSGYRSSPNNTDAHDITAGPFRRYPYTQWKDGDLFEVYPAVYEGENQQIFVGPNIENDAAYSAGLYVTPKNITIRGIAVAGVRPVIKLPTTGASNANYGQGLIYIDKSENIVIENIDVISNDSGKGALGKGAIYINGGKNVTLRNMRIAGFSNRSINGIFATGNNSGTLLLENIELDSNGGGGGPEHNIYVNASTIDNNFTLKMTGSWSHDSYYGHLFKSRAQINILEGNYFQGSKSANGEMRESWQMDIPEGGTLIARNNIFTKNASGNNTNGASITYGVERNASNFDLNRPWKLVIEHNTFVAFTRYFDTQNHAVWPMFLNTAVPVLPADVSIRNNVFVGYCQAPSTVFGNAGYLGQDYSVLDFNGIDQAFRPRVPKAAASSAALGTSQYLHKLQIGVRRTTAIGARD